jgi:hypothetical protein
MLPLWITLGVNHFVVLETIADFVHLNPLVVCAPWFIVLHAFVLLPYGFTKSTAPLVSSPLLFVDPIPLRLA